MSEPENFLSRWSRRKREIDAEQPQAAPETAAQDSAQERAQDTAQDTASTEKSAANPGPALPEPVFDPASLPPLESIGAQTDITAFLKAGVPSQLRLAALRRAWLADPAIRDFKGMAEYDWDFTVPDSMRGFGEMDPGTDVQKMLTEMFPDAASARERVAELTKPSEQITPSQQEPSGPPEPDTAPAAEAKVESTTATQIQTAKNKNMLQREENIAAQDTKSESDDPQIKRRRSQGGAMPQ